MRMRELKALVDAALEATRVDRKAMEGVDHPQVRDLRLAKDGVIDALEAVASAIRGDAVLLRIKGGRA